MKEVYRFPSYAKRPDGSRRFAYVTFLMCNDSYLPGALLSAYSLRGKGADADLVCLVTEDISDRARYALGMLYDHVVEMENIYMPTSGGNTRQHIPSVFTRFNALRVGADGDMGFKYEKIVLMDADLLPLRFFDHLFTLNTPAGVINERRTNMLVCDGNGRFRINPDTWGHGKWIWHEKYDATCPHGDIIPGYMTDRVKTDPENMGVNSALWVLKPSMGTFIRIKGDLEKPETRIHISEHLKWPEMQYATLLWSGVWTSVDARFAGLNGYPHHSLLCGTHYAGIKPWSGKCIGSAKRLCRFPDYMLWYGRFLEMMGDESLPLYKIGKLSRLADEISRNFSPYLVEAKSG